MSSTATVNIRVTDINDEAPVFSDTVAFRVKEVLLELRYVSGILLWIIHMILLL
jgi:hypothetical protein